jgi:integrase
LDSLASSAEGCTAGLTVYSVPLDNTLKSYESALAAFLAEFRDRQIGEITTEEILSFLNRVTEGKKPQTRRIRYAQLSAFFNFVRNNLDPEFRKPCDTPAMKRLYRNRAPSRWNTIDKDIIDEVIFKTVKPRNRLMMELMARGGMRVGEVLKLTPSDVNERKLTLREPKSGRIEDPCTNSQGVSHLTRTSYLFRLAR